MAKAQFPEPKDLEVPVSDLIGDGVSYNFQKYDVSNPHPGYGKDPNILNEFGHTVYPKMIYPNGPKGLGVIVNNKDEEDQVMGVEKPAPVQAPAAAGGWGSSAK